MVVLLGCPELRNNAWFSVDSGSPRGWPCFHQRSYSGWHGVWVSPWFLIARICILSSTGMSQSCTHGHAMQRKVCKYLHILFIFAHCILFGLWCHFCGVGRKSQEKNRKQTWLTQVHRSDAAKLWHVKNEETQTNHVLMTTYGRERQRDRERE